MKKSLYIFIPAVLLITITIILLPYHASKETVHKKVDPKTEMVKKIARMLKEQSQIKEQKASPIVLAPIIEEKEIEPQDRVMASSLREEIKRSIKEGKKDIRIVLNTTDDKEEVSNSVIKVGGRIIRKRPGFMAVEVPVDKAEQIIMGDSSIGYARLPFKFYPTGKVSEGVSLTGASIFNDTIYRGSGIKVAVVDVGFKGLTAAITAGELPADVKTQDFSDSGLQTEYKHGTACAEIIHDMAPDAELHLVKIGDELGGYEIIDYCIDNNIDIVSLSIGTFGTGPGDGTGPLDEAFDELREAGILVVASAGNHGDINWGINFVGSHWEGTFRDTDFDTYHEFKVIRSSTIYYTYLIIRAYPGKDDDGNPETNEVSIMMRWNDWPLSDIDYDMELYSYDYETKTVGSLVTSSTTPQTGTQSPLEYISINLPGIEPAVRFYALKVKRRDTEIPSGTKLEIYLGGTSKFFPIEYSRGNYYYFSIPTSSIVEPADAESVMAVGAINYMDWRKEMYELEAESYSSQGPTNDWNGSAARIKPDIMGPDDVTTYTYGDAYISGTSVATPHVAGIAALNLGMNPDMTPDELQKTLEDNTVDKWHTKYEKYGWGRVRAVTPIFPVKSYQKINNTEGNFKGVIGDYDQFGQSITPIGDLNGDGVIDLAVGAPHDDDGGSCSGAIWILFMNSNGTVKLHQKISDTAGNLDICGYIGSSVAAIGDLNKDGTEDLAVGAYEDDRKGAVWILFMNPNGTVKAHQKINETEGNFTGTLPNPSGFGSSITYIHDLNGDGVGDLAVGATNDNGGAVWILFMNTNGTVKSHLKISYAESFYTDVFDNFYYFGRSVAYIGDINKDGTGDLAVGALGLWDEGEIFILFMNPNGTIKSYQKISRTEGNFTGYLNSYSNFGKSITSMGDLNGDGINDLAVGATDASHPEDDVNEVVWILFMNADGTVKTQLKISDTLKNFNGTLNDSDNFGSSVASIGDLNGDGIGDLAVGAIGDGEGDIRRGAVWILFLDYAPFDLDIDGMSDHWEKRYGLNSNVNDSTGDYDGDGLTNIIEFKGRTLPKEADTDNDGINDGNEDKNHNGVLDAGETNPNNTDTDHDGMPDGWEVQYGLNPLANDTGEDLDGDHFSNIKEYQEGTLPNDRKSRPKTGMPWLPLLLGD